MLSPVKLAGIGLAALLVTLLLMRSCGGPPQIEYLPEDATILAFGNSLTHGTGVKRPQSYPAQLQAIINRKVINAGVPGELSAEGLRRLPGLLDQHKPKLLILTHGGNDMLRKKDLKAAADNLRAMIRLSRERGIPVVMMGVPNPTLILSPAPFYEEVATELQVPIALDTISNVLQFPSNKSDAVHPNEKGYRRMAEELAELLKETGAI